MTDNNKNLSILDCFNKHSVEYFNNVLMSKSDDMTEYQAAINASYNAEEAIHDDLIKKPSPVQEYIDAVTAETWLEFEILYHQGLRDCVLILRKLGMIN